MNQNTPQSLRKIWGIRDEDLAADLIERIGWFRLELVTTPAIADEAARWLSDRITALSAVIEDERKHPSRDRDWEWLAGARLTLAEAQDLYFAVSRKRAELRMAA